MHKRINAWKTFAAVLIILLHISPIYILVNIAFKDKSDLTSRWLPARYIYFDNFPAAMREGNLGRAIFNTALIVVLAVAIIVVVGAMASYPLSRNQTRKNRIILSFFVGVMMVPALSILVPLYKEMVQLGGVNTFWGIIIVSATFNLPMAIYMYTNFISAIPVELDEAAMIDGCSRLGIFTKIILPNLKPVTASVIIWCAVGIWNDYQFQLYFLQKPAMQTITLAISGFFTDTKMEMGPAAAAALIVVLPPVIMYLLLQKQFVKGAMDSAVK